MEDNYFDKKLKAILKSPPEFKPDEGAIGDMRSRLRTQRQSKRKPMLWWYVAAAAVLLPFFLLAGFGVRKYNLLHNEMSELRAEVNRFQNSPQQDTLIIKEMIHHYDTVYTTIIRGATPLITPRSAKQTDFVRGLASSKNRLTALTITYTPEIWNRSSDGGIYSLFTDHRGAGSFNRIGLGGVFPPTTYNAWQTDLETLASLPPRMLAGPERSTPAWLKTLKERTVGQDRRINPLFFFTPENLSLEVNGSPWLQMLDKRALGSSSVYGAAAAIHFPAARSLRIGAELIQTSFELKDEDTDDYADYPIVNPTDPADVLHELKGRLTSLQVPVTLRQELGRNDRWKPFIDLGIVASRPLRQAFIYEYINGSGEYKLTNTLREGDFSIENIRLGFGLDYCFVDRWSLSSTLYYQHDFREDVGEYFKTSQIQWQFGLSYRLSPQNR